MFSKHKLQTILEEIKEISGLPLALFNERGRLLVNTDPVEDAVGDGVALFVDSSQESGRVGNWQLFQVDTRWQTEYVLAVEALTEECSLIGRMAACQIKNIISIDREQNDKNYFMQHILLGNILAADMMGRAKQLQVEQKRRLVYVIDLAQGVDGNVKEYLRHMFSSASDFVTEINDKSISLVKDIQGMEEKEFEQLATAMVAHLETEAMVKVRVGYGNPADNLKDLPRSYQEACLALTVGEIFSAEKAVISYNRLGIGRLIYQLPVNLCEMFLQEVFGGKIPERIDEETSMIIQRFFDNNLNISETSRQLFIHRNSLVYRLERILKETGLDMRNFEDALLFRIAMMVRAYVKQQKMKKKVN
ncbi:hypothetical protein FACS1894111_11780 [Clostridia bacterium]|nr:hypothetical protein FACS1894111_11780 [Clostridia bacterium]